MDLHQDSAYCHDFNDIPYHNGRPLSTTLESLVTGSTIKTMLRSDNGYPLHS